MPTLPNAAEPIVGTLPLNVILSRFVQSLNAELPILVTLSGIVTDFKPEHR